MFSINSSSASSSSQSLPFQESIYPTDSKIETIRDKVLTAIRNHVPIEPLFRPELKINLNTFIKDQMLFYEMAVFIMSIDDPKEFEKFPRLQEIKGLFKENAASYLTFLYHAVSDVMTKKPYVNHLKTAIEGRIFTLKNALIAQHNPEAIRKSQTDYKIAPHPNSSIQNEGASFIRESISIHLKVLQNSEKSLFKDNLIQIATQLIPFVQKVTRTYVIEQKSPCPENPLTFRNPKGYNHHGFVAATVMEVCLNALGFKTRLMGRCDLEPKVTLSTAHNVIEVTAPDSSQFMVDPSYIQFHKDICLNDALLPTSPVLVLGEAEIDDYIEQKIMAQWKKNVKLFEEEDSSTIQEIVDRDQWILYKVESIGLPREMVPQDVDAWIRDAFKRVWGIKSYSHIHSNGGLREIFFENTVSPKTYELVKPMELTSLTYHMSLKDVEDRLQKLLTQPNVKKQNSLEALSLIAKLPSLKREAYKSLLDVDPEIKGFGPVINAYFRSLKKQVNPKGEDKTVIYACSGADCMSVMLATDATEYLFMDLTPINYSDFESALARFKQLNEATEKQLIDYLDKSDFYITQRLRTGGSMSKYLHEKHVMTDLALKVLYDLREGNVDLNKIVFKNDKNGVEIHFPWTYYDASLEKPLEKQRVIKYITADVTKPDEYPDYLKEKIVNGFDLFYMKSAFFVPKHYSDFLPYLAKSIKAGGWLMTADKTSTMESFSPDITLKKSELTFSLKEKEEIKILEELMAPPFHPFNSVPTLAMNPPNNRQFRMPGSDLSYWTILSLRQKEL